MAKENEKKVSGNMSDDELTNVAGGWCMTGGKSAPSNVKKSETVQNKNGTYSIITTFKSGQKMSTTFDRDGNILGNYTYV